MIFFKSSCFAKSDSPKEEILMLRERCKCIIGRVREHGKTMHLIIEARGVYI